MSLRLLVGFTLCLALVAPAAAQAPGGPAAPAERMNAGPLGSVAMAREAAPGPDGAASVMARVHLNASAALSAGARHVLIGVGNDVASSLVVRIESVVDGSGKAVPAESVEAQGSYRAQWWLDPSKLPASVDLVVSATAKPGATAVDVETLVMAFDAGYRALNASDGRALTLQTFTTVAAAPTPPTENPDPPVGNDTNGTGGPPPNASFDGGGDEASRRLPGPGAPAVVFALAVAVALVGVGRRRR